MARRPPSLVRAGVDRLAAAWGASPTVTAVVVDHGHRVVFAARHPDGSAVYVKVDDGGRRYVREALALTAAGAAGAPVPGVRLADPGPPSVLAVEAVAGRPLAGIDTAEAWRTAGTALRRLHDVPPPPGMPSFREREPDWNDSLRRWMALERDLVTSRRLLDPAVAGTLHDAVEATLTGRAGPETVVLHGDCQPEHVFLDDGGTRVLALIDLGDASTGDPLWDVTVLTLDHPHRLDDVLAGYGGSAALGARAAEVLPAYQAVRVLSSATWLVDHGFDPRAYLDLAIELAGRLSS